MYGDQGGFHRVGHLYEFFQFQYFNGGQFAHPDFEFMEEEWVWRYKPLNIKVWADLLDLSEKEARLLFRGAEMGTVKFDFS